YLKNETIFSPPTTTNTTIAFWVNLDTIITDNTWEGQEIILGIRKNPSTYMYFGLRNSKFIFRTAGGGLSDLSIQSNQKLGDSHIILEWNTNNTFSMWVDGVLIDTQSQVWANSDGYDSEIWIGRFPSDYVGSPYSQVIEDIRYIEGILTNDEKLSLYNYGKGQRGNANFLPISNGVERPFGKQFENTLAWWKLDGTALDEISGTSMTINGTATYTTGKQYDNAISFDGVTQSAYKAMTIPTSSCSISMWVKFNSNSGEDYFMRSDCDDMTYLTFNGSIIRFAKGTTYTRIADSPTITTGVWYNVIVMWESGTAYFYFNNVEYNDGSSSFPAGSDGTYVSLASFNTSAGNQGSDCEFTDVRIFPYLLSEEQRSAIYNDNIGSTDNSETYPKYLITDKDYWGEPDYEIEKTGSLQSWNTF
ncbi:MAG: hypothetical protein EOM21_20860, partial [Gammaproteobacteria bacterium]|nr:hypothetical protein [Gammaproteobacteria bacterium]